MIRWVSPVKQFMRTATDDYVLRGVTDPGGRVGAALVSVGQPRRGGVRARPTASTSAATRTSTSAFGFGAHYCLGTQLARMEGRALYNELIPRLQSIELAGEPSYMQTLFVGGPKHLPIRYELV